MTETADAIATATEVRFHTGYSHGKNWRKYYVIDAEVHIYSALSREEDILKLGCPQEQFK